MEIKIPEGYDQFFRVQTDEEACELFGAANVSELINADVLDAYELKHLAFLTAKHEYQQIFELDDVSNTELVQRSDGSLLVVQKAGPSVYEVDINRLNFLVRGTLQDEEETDKIIKEYLDEVAKGYGWVGMQKAIEDLDICYGLKVASWRIEETCARLGIVNYHLYHYEDSSVIVPAKMPYHKLLDVLDIWA